MWCDQSARRRAGSVVALSALALAALLATGCAVPGADWLASSPNQGLRAEPTSTAPGPSRPVSATCWAA